MLQRILIGLYRALLYAYPRDFRLRFGGEMAQVFRDSLRDAAQAKALSRFVFSSLSDWLTAVALQRIDAVRTPESLTGIAQHAIDGVPVFYTCADDIPRPSALINGGFLAIGVFAVVSFLIGHGGAPRFFLIGSHHPSPSHMLPAYTNAVSTSDLDAEITAPPFPDAIPIAPYFRDILVLAALDTDQNNVISEREIANAASSLRRLDRRNAGRLTAEDCGFRAPDGNADDPDRPKRLRIAFMRTHPVLVVLDADHDGEISSAEIKGAPARLKLLDRNGDGRLTLDELFPDPFEATAINVMAAFDRNGDGRLSAGEISAIRTLSLRGSLARADKDEDGYVTDDELRRAMLAGELEAIHPRLSLPVPTR